VTYLIPVVAVVLGVVALGERAGWNLLAGGAVVIAGVALTEGRLRWRKSDAPAPPSPAVEPPSSRTVDTGPC
jgi:hypothetical protein